MSTKDPLNSSEPISSDDTDCSAGPESLPGQPATAAQHAEAIRSRLDPDQTGRMEEDARKRPEVGKIMREGAWPNIDQSLSGNFSGRSSVDMGPTVPDVKNIQNQIPINIQIMYRPGQVRMQFTRECDAIDLTSAQARVFIQMMQQHLVLAESQERMLAIERAKRRRMI